MFMMPIPPTIKRNGRNAHQHEHHRPARAGNGLGNILHGADGEIVFFRGMEVMSGSQEVFDVLHDGRESHRASESPPG